MNIFVTGGAGFIGSFLTEHLLQNSHNVTIYDSLVNSSEDNVKKLQKLNASFIYGDIADLENLSKSIADHDVCIHLAAQIDVLESIKNPLNNNTINISGTRNVLDSCVKNNVSVIAASTAFPPFLRLFSASSVDNGCDVAAIAFEEIASFSFVD